MDATRRTWYLVPIILVTALVAGCASPPQPSARASRAPSAISSPSADLLIISAVYGSGTTFADVSYRVDDLLHQPGIEFFARPKWLGVDPTPGWNKALVIVYEYRGRRHTFTTGEGGKVSVEQLIERAKNKPKRKMEHKTYPEPVLTEPAAATVFMRQA